MNLHEIKIRRLEIATEMGRLAEQDVALRRQMLEVEAQSTALQRELAGLDLEEASIQLRYPKVKRGD